MTATILQPNHDALLRRVCATLPALYRVPAVVPTLQEAQAWCRDLLAEALAKDLRLAVGLFPRSVRPHLYAVFAYWWISRDLGAQVDNPSAALELLDLWAAELNGCYAGRARHPVFIALADTIHTFDLPREPFADLLTALRQDQTVAPYRTMADVLAYCRSSANPLGRLVLSICGEADEERFRLSDAFCSALQLAEFWQNVGTDFARGRVYLPQEDMRRFGVTDETLVKGVATPAFRALLDYEVDFARRLLDEGLPLIGRVGRELAVSLDFVSRQALEILRAIERQDYDVLSARPSIAQRTKIALALRAAGVKFLPFLRLGPR